jgi:hypothetical protein
MGEDLRRGVSKPNNQNPNKYTNIKSQNSKS